MMYSFYKLATLLALVPLISASPVEHDLSLDKRALDTSSHCGQWDTVTATPYSLLLDQWGAGGASSGSQCANFVSQSGTTVAWKTTWTWVGGNGVKSFTNIQLNSGINKQLSAIKTMTVKTLIIPYLVWALIAYSIYSPRGSGRYHILAVSWLMLHMICLRPTPRVDRT